MNTQFNYLYRDGGNWKNLNSVVLEGTLDDKQINEICDLMDGLTFIPRQVGLPEERFPESPTEDDHCWFEVVDPDDAFKPTDNPPTIDMTAQELYEKFLEVNGEWDDIRYAYGVFDFPLCPDNDNEKIDWKNAFIAYVQNDLVNSSAEYVREVLQDVVGLSNEQMAEFGLDLER